MSKKEIILYSVIGILIMGVGILFFTLFKGNNQSANDKLFNQLVKAKDETISVYKEKEEVYKTLIEEKERGIANIETRFNQLYENYQSNQLIYSKLNDQLKNIPNRILSIATNDDSIRSAFRQFMDKER